MPIGEGLVFHSDAGSQYTSYAYTGRLKEAGIAPSIGTVADALDNAMAESVISSFKNEEITQNGPWKKPSDAELATLTADNGLTVVSSSWDGPQGGHHVVGTLSFPAEANGELLLTDASSLTLTINNVDAPERIFSWELP